MGGARAISRGVAARPARSLAALLALLVLALAWMLAAHALWHSTVPERPAVCRTSIRIGCFSASFLERSASYERFLDIDGVLGELTLLVVLALYARRGHRLMHESAAGRIGTGMMLGMLGFGLVVARRDAVRARRRLVGAPPRNLPSGLRLLAARQLPLARRHVPVRLARAASSRWRSPACCGAGGGPSPRRSSPRSRCSRRSSASTWSPTRIRCAPNRPPPTCACSRARRASLGRTAEVQDVDRETTAPNAESVGFGSTRRVILWDTLLDGRFDRREVDVVAAHELGHLAHHHTLKRVGWLAAVPAARRPRSSRCSRAVAAGSRGPRPCRSRCSCSSLLQLLTRAADEHRLAPRGGRGRLVGAAARRTTPPPRARSVRKLATTSLADPDPPAWSYVLYADHPTIVQRIAMVDAWQARSGR